MSPILRALALFAIPLAATAPGVAGAVPSMASGVIAAYYPGYAAAEYPVARIPAAKLTHLFYAFARIEEGQCVVDAQAHAHFDEFARLKREHPRLRTLISIGGWNADGFSDAALSAARRRRLVDSCLSLFLDRHAGSFDGVDLDWEFPVSGGPAHITARPQDRRGMTLLAREFRRALDARTARAGGRLLLTAALPAGRLQVGGAYDPARSFELAALARTLDFVNLMTYDMGTAHLRVTGLNAPLREDPASPLDPALRAANTVDGAIADYVRQGVPADRMVLGVPFFGREYRLGSDGGNGLLQPFEEAYEAGGWRRIAGLAAEPGWRRYWHPVAQSPWLHHAGQRLFVTYEDPESIGIRARLARERGLRGVFAWEITGDDDAHGLLDAMRAPFVSINAGPTRADSAR